MSISRRVSCLLIGLFACTFAPTGPTALGGPVSGNFTGTFLGGTPPSSVPSYIQPGTGNTAINGHFAYSVADLTGVKNSNGSYTYNLTKSTSNSGEALVFTVGTGESWNDYYVSGAFTITLAKSGNGSTMTIESSTKTGGDLIYTLTSASYATLSVLPTTQTQIGTFQGVSGVKYSTPDPWGTVPDQIVNGSQFSGDTASVPEPSSLMLGVVAAMTVSGGLLIARRKARMG